MLAKVLKLANRHLVKYLCLTCWSCSEAIKAATTPLDVEGLKCHAVQVHLSLWSQGVPSIHSPPSKASDGNMKAEDNMP